MTRYRVGLIFVLLFMLAASAVASDVGVRQIEIKSYWGGLGQPQNTELLIRNEKGVYHLDGEKIGAAQVDAFIAAVNEPVIPNPSIENLGLTKMWLEGAAQVIVGDAKKREEEDSTYWAIGSGTPEQQSLFKGSYTDTAFIGKVLPELFRCCHTDDYPGVRITIRFSNGSSIVISSHSQSEYMLPWKVERSGRSTQTFNRNISTALTNLLPDGATNRERISGESFGLALARAVMGNIEKQWNLLRAEGKDGKALERIRANYTLVSADVNPYHDVTFGVYSRENGPEEENLHALVTKPSFPRGFFENVILLFKDDRVHGVNTFLQQAGRYEELVLSVPWLSRVRAKYPKVGVSLLWVHDSSFSDKAMQQFAADMHVLRKDTLANEVRKVQRDVAVLNVNYGDWWLVLPDQRMVLWRYQSVSGLLGFKQSQFSVKECTDYQGVTGGCVGAVVSPEGVLAR